MCYLYSAFITVNHTGDKLYFNRNAYTAHICIFLLANDTMARSMLEESYIRTIASITIHTFYVRTFSICPPDMFEA